MMDVWGFWGWFLLAVAACFVVWDMVVTWAALRVSSQAGDDAALMFAAPPQPADGDDYTYPQRTERLIVVADLEERIDALEDEISQLVLRIRALEGKQ